MGKYKKESKEYKSYEEGKQFDRPVNDEIQLKFMSKIRGAKVQLINTESQLEIQLGLNNLQKKVKQNKKKTQQDKQIWQARDKLQEIIIQNFKEINSQKKVVILKKYNQLVQSFKFLQVKELPHRPKYLFDDGKDLSYVLHQINIQKIKKLEDLNPNDLYEATPLRPEEFFLLGLLCLNDRNQLSVRFIQKFLGKSTLVVRLIKYGLDLIHEQLKEKLKKGEPLTFYQQNYSEYSDEDQQQSGRQQEDQQDQQEGSLKQVSTAGKTKKISKQQRLQRSSSCLAQQKDDAKPKLNVKIKQQEIQLTQDERIVKFIQKFVNHIVWSYKYVFDEQLKLRIKGQKTCQQIAAKFPSFPKFQGSFNFK